MASPVATTAASAHKAGICVVPVREDGSKKLIGGSWKHLQEKRPSVEDLRRWFVTEQRGGLAFLCGKISANTQGLPLEMLEFDEPDLLDKFKDEAERVGLGDLIQRLTNGYLERTPRPGMHLAYYCADVGGSTALAKRPKRSEEMKEENDKTHTMIETRGEGSYFIAAPSNGKVHPSGGRYELLHGDVTTIPVITPDERQDLFDYCRTFDQMGREPASPSVRSSKTGPSDGNRPGDDFNARAGWPDLLPGWKWVYRRGEVDYLRRPGKNQGISATINHKGSDLFYPFTSSTEFDPERSYDKFGVYTVLEHGGDFKAAARALAAQGYGSPRSPNGPPPSGDAATDTALADLFRLTDTGNAERLVDRHGQDIRFNYGRKVWHVWTGTHWGEDDAGRMDQLAKETVRAIPEEARGLEGEAYTRHLKWAASSESAGKRAAMIDLARSEEGVPVQPAQLDSDPWLLNVANGTLDLRTGELSPHERGDLISRCISTPYLPDEKCPTFLAFLDRIFSGNTELIDYVQRMVGYALTGSTREQVVFIAHGNGSNGKSTLLGCISTLLENYATEADTDSFLERHGERIREDIAALEGARFVAASETADGKRLSEAFIKKATGGEKLRARRLFENGYTFEPTFKIWLSTNHRPEIVGTDHAIWRRIRLIPFAVTIPDEERDKDLPTKLEAELPGILAWAVVGCSQWLRQGEQPPTTVLKATEQYRRDMDALANWIQDRCELRPGARATSKALYADYVDYCQDASEEPLKQRTFGTRLTERGCGEERTGRARYRTGIRLRDSNEPVQESLNPDLDPGSVTTSDISSPHASPRKADKAGAFGTASDASDASDAIFGDLPRNNSLSRDFPKKASHPSHPSSVPPTDVGERGAVPDGGNDGTQASPERDPAPVEDDPFEEMYGRV